jgi:N-acetylated-alpha-linked acidic dipeptidase
MSDSERQPLIQRVRVAARHPNKRPHACSRFIGIAIGSTLIFMLGCVILPVLLIGPATSFKQAISRLPRYIPWWMPTPHGSWPATRGIEYEDLVDTVISTPNPKLIRQSSGYYTSGPHLAGLNYTEALWTKKLWETYGVASKIVSYEVLLNYPLDHRLALLKQTNKTGYTVEFEASLAEDVLKEDSTTGLKDRVPTFHGYSANGNVTAPFVFVNYGTVQDYKDLADAGISIKGKIAIAKYGRNMRGLKVAGAEDYGAVGCLIYSDPGERLQSVSRRTSTTTKQCSTWEC